VLRAWSVADNRAAETVRLAQVPDGALMQRAAAGLAAVCARELRVRSGGVSGRRVVLLVGAGNNGGDALYAGERLARRGAGVEAVLLASREKVHRAGLSALLAAGGRVADGVLVPAEADLVIDGIVGLGGTAGLRPPAVEAVASIPSGTRVIAVDLPSGVDPDTAELPAADEAGRARHVTAAVTVTFGARKPCLLLPPADRAAGRVELVDIGLGPLLAAAPVAAERLEPADAAALWPVPRDGVGMATHKYSRGVLGVLAGSDRYPGAAVLVVAGALRAGLGMVRYVGPEQARRAVLAAWPEVVAAPGQVQAWTVGSGFSEDRAEQIRRLLAEPADALPAVVDAGALGLLPDRPRPAPTVLTPHAGELATLLGACGVATTRAQVEARPLEHARRAAELTGAVVLLKGATTVIVGAEPAGPRVVTQADATPWLATAGAGDVLAGVIGALLAGGLNGVDAAALGALVHGRAAREASHGRAEGPGGPIVAGDVAAALPGVIRNLLADREPVA